MELWIRSQDKENLVLTKGFELQNPSYNGGCQIFAVWQNNYQCVGNYKSKERALEVLDEIQDLLKPPIIFQEHEGVIATNDNSLHIINPTYGEIKQLKTIVYEMPKD